MMFCAGVYLPDNVRSRSGQRCSPARNGRFARPCDRSTYTYMSSGRSPARLVSFSQVPPRSALRNCGFVPKPCFWGLSAQPSASPLKTLRVFRRLPGPDRGRAWHPQEFGAVLVVSASLALASASGWSAHRADHRQAAVTPLPAPPLPSPSRRYAPQCFVGGIPPSRLATCLTAHPTNRVAACRSVRHSPPRPLPHLPLRRVCLRSSCARRRSVSELNPRRNSRDAIRRYMTLIDPTCFANNFVRAVISFRRG